MFRLESIISRLIGLLSIDYTYYGEKIDISFASFTIALVFAVCIVLLSVAKAMPKIELANKNNCATTYKIFASLTPITIEKAVKNVYRAYMILWLAYTVITPMLDGENIISLIMLGIFVVNFLCIVKPPEYFRMGLNGGVSFQFPAGTAVLTLVLAIFSDAISEQTIIDMAVVALFSWLAQYVVSFDMQYSKQTMYYENNRKNDDTYVKEETKEYVELIRNGMPYADKIKDIDDVNAVEDIATDIVPYFDYTKAMTNEEYRENMNSAMEYNGQNADKTYYSNALISGVNGYCEGALKANYSVDDYKPEAIKKVFEALDYNESPTPENYIRLRKTADLLSLAYQKRLDDLRAEYKGVDIDDYKVIANGLIGERRVEEALNKIKGERKDIEILYNLTFYPEKRTSAYSIPTEIDALIITKNKIYCVEVKNNGENKEDRSIQIENDGVWYYKYSNGEMEPINGDPKKSCPHNQNDTHIRRLKEKYANQLSFGKNGIPEIYSMIVVANDIGIYGDEDKLKNVFHIDSLCDKILQDIGDIDNDAVDTVNKIKRVFESNNDNDYEGREHIDHVAITKKISELALCAFQAKTIAGDIKLSEKYRII